MDVRSTRLVSAFHRVMSIWPSNEYRSGTNLTAVYLSFITTTGDMYHI